jgi:hypothetical protein
MLNRLTLFLFCILVYSSKIGYCQSDSAPAKRSPSDTSATQEGDSYLELRGTVRHLKGNESTKANPIKPLDSALITIYNGDVPYSELWTNKKGKCSFKLPLDKNFVIQVAKVGFVTKSVAVYTKVPVDKREVYVFNFDVDLFEVVNGLDVSILNNPIAKVAYHLADENFGYDVAYTNKINLDLKKMYKNYYRLQKLEADSMLYKMDSTQVIK